MSNFKIGSIVKIINGGLGAYGADGKIGKIIPMPSKEPKSYGGDFFGYAALYVEIKDSPSWEPKVWGLTKGCEVKEIFVKYEL